MNKDKVLIDVATPVLKPLFGELGWRESGRWFDRWYYTPLRSYSLQHFGILFGDL